MNNEFNPHQNEITMSIEEQKNHKSIFSKICLSFVLYIISSEVISALLVLFLEKSNPDILKSGNFSMIASAVIQYLIAFPIFYFAIKRTPSLEMTKKPLNLKSFIKLLSISIFVMYVGEYISGIVSTFLDQQFGSPLDNPVDDILAQSNIWLSLIVVGIIGPIVEELMFRKLIIDRLARYGEAISILFSSLVFGLLHGNLSQFFYAFLVGIILSYVYVKTGKIVYSSIIHCFINIFRGVAIFYITTLLDLEEFLNILYTEGFTEEYYMANRAGIDILAAYSIIFSVLLIMGIFNFNRSLFRVRLNKGTVRLPKETRTEIIFFNAGAIALIVLSVITIAINTFSFALSNQ